MTEHDQSARDAAKLARVFSGKPITPKYPNPRILLLDIPGACESALLDAGYDVSVGTFGYPYRVAPSDAFSVVSMDTAALPGLEEQDIVVVNTACPPPITVTPSLPGDGVSAIWQRADNGQVDPRPHVMRGVQPICDRILAYGGVAIVLLGARYDVEYTSGVSRGRNFDSARSYSLSSWSFLSVLEDLPSDVRRGDQINFSTDLGALLKRGAVDARYGCTLHPTYAQEEHWITLAKNKYDECVAGMLMQNEPQVLLIALPQMPHLHTILPDLIGRWCARWRPSLFPFHDRQTWLYADQYELPAVTAIRRSIRQIEEEANAKMKDLTDEIEKTRSDNKDWYTLLNGTDADLVGAVIRTLQKLGFRQVIDMDTQARAAGEGRKLREDIQVRDRSPTLVINVKGVLGCPEDHEATQSEKHALMRAKELKGDVKALTIINHERNLPPHDRNPNPYRVEIVENAKQTDLGLMTSWDLFRLSRNKEALNWPEDAVKSVFYRTGRIEPVPDHYVAVGQIVRVWRDAFGVIPTEAIPKGARLAIEVGDLFEEITADSLRVDDRDVNVAPPGSNCGVAYEKADERYKKAMRVFLVRETPCA